MRKLLLQHFKQSFKRSTFKKERQYEDFMKVFLIVYLSSATWGGLIAFLEYLNNTYSIPRIEAKILFILLFPAIDLISRYFFQRVPNLNLRPYLTLPIQKQTIVKSVILQSLRSLWFFLFLIGYIVAIILIIRMQLSISQKSILILYLIGVMFLMHFLNFFIKTGGKHVQNSFYGFYFVVTFIAVLQRFNWIDIIPWVNSISKGLSKSLLLPILPITLTGLVLWRIVKNLPEQLSRHTSSDISKKSLPFQIFSRYGDIGKQVDQEIFMASRLKAVKNTVLFSLFWIAYPLIVGISIDNKNGSSLQFIYLIFGMFISYGMIQYASYCFSWHTFHFNAIQLNQKMKTVLRGKYFFIILVGLAVSLLGSIFYYFVNKEFIVFIWVGFFYNIAISIFLSIYFSLKYTKPKNPYKGTSLYSNNQDFNLETLLIGLLYLIGILIPYIIGRLIWNHEIGLVMVLIMSLLFILSHNLFLNQMLKVYQKNRYHIYRKFKAFEKND